MNDNSPSYGLPVCIDVGKSINDDLAVYASTSVFQSGLVCKNTNTPTRDQISMILLSDCRKHLGVTNNHPIIFI